MIRLPPAQSSFMDAPNNWGSQMDGETMPVYDQDQENQESRSRRQVMAGQDSAKAVGVVSADLDDDQTCCRARMIRQRQ